MPRETIFPDPSDGDDALARYFRDLKKEGRTPTAPPTIESQQTVVLPPEGLEIDETPGADQ